ncbi:MAG: helix-hairpin-helix domain-containing protein [Clostridiaceae bacterium]
MKINKKIIGSIIIASIFLIFIVVRFSNSGNEDNYEDVFQEDSMENVSTNEIKVYVVGEIKNPGVYSLKEGDRIENLVDLAGGFTENADNVSVNLAKILKDQDKIVVYPKVSIEEGNVEENQSSKRSDGKININTATDKEFEEVPGIGEVTAKNIIKYRETNGYFNSIDDLKNVDRIGDKTLEKLKEYLDAW